MQQQTSGTSFSTVGARATHETLRAAAAMPGAGVVVRDDAWRLKWCNDVFASKFGETSESLHGTDLYALMPATHAEERMRLAHPAMQRGVMTQYVCLWRGRRTIVTVFGLEAAAFGHDGILTMLVPVVSPSDGRLLPVCASSILTGGLEKLSRMELCVAYLLSRLMTNDGIATRLTRSPHTVTDHIKALHRKLNISRAPELTAYLIEMGIAGFTEQEWCLVSGATIPNPGVTLEVKPSQPSALGSTGGSTRVSTDARESEI